MVEAGQIYRSGQISPSLIDDVLEDRRIGLVTDMAGYEANNPEDVAEQRAIEARGIRLERVPMYDDGVGWKNG